MFIHIQSYTDEKPFYLSLQYQKLIHNIIAFQNVLIAIKNLK